jgi:hypothetical protein
VDEGEDYGLIAREAEDDDERVSDAGVAAPPVVEEDYGLIDDEPQKPGEADAPPEP